MSENKYSMWFAKRKESNVMDGTKEHILKIVDTCEEMSKMIAAIIEKDYEKAKQAYSRLDLNEKAADSIEVSLNVVCPPPTRANLMPVRGPRMKTLPGTDLHSTRAGQNRNRWVPAENASRRLFDR